MTRSKRYVRWFTCISTHRYIVGLLVSILKIWSTGLDDNETGHLLVHETELHYAREKAQQRCCFDWGPCEVKQASNKFSTYDVCGSMDSPPCSFHKLILAVLECLSDLWCSHGGGFRNARWLVRFEYTGVTGSNTFGGFIQWAR